jgi:hypothetical protein
MAIKKSELYSSLWQSCDELRGGMDASQYKDYVLVLLFVKYVSDKYAGVPYAPITIPEGASFTDMIALKGKPDIGDQINKKIIGPLANANRLSDMPDFNDASKLGSGPEIVERLTNLISIFENRALDFSKNRAEGDDILGDAYEYLMRHFATESGKSKGQFYTPAEVSRIMAQIIGIRDAQTTNNTTVYDPTCGSGSLLLKVGDEASAKVTLYGQEKDAATSGLARMNMILHNNPTALIKQGNTLANPLFTANRPGYLDLAVPKQAIKPTIYEHPEFVTFINSMNTLFADWQQRSTETLKGLEAGCHPKNVIALLAEELLAHYTGKPLIDKYDVYQHLMDYWSTVMQDDCYLIAADGWKAETYRVIEKDKKGKEKDKGWTCDLIPKPLIVDRYFAAEQAAIREQEAALESVAAQMTEMEEEHGGEEGAFSELDKVNKANVTARLKEFKGESGEVIVEEKGALEEWLKLCNQEADLKKTLKEAEAALDALAYTKYPKLTVAEIKTLVVEDKWLATISAAIHGEMDRISQALTQRVKELAERYETPLPQAAKQVAELEQRVNKHLQRMGFL